jgi:glutathione S-transferase
MGIIATENQEVRTHKGLHLYHGDISNCSMRVRMALEEKGLPWISHHLDLKKNETRTPAYFAVNPMGLVPALVHDGVLIIESDDILEYIDNTFEQPALKPTDQIGKDEVHGWLKLATSIHIKAVKTTIYTNKMRGVFKHSGVDTDEYAKLQKDPELLAFHRISSSAEGFSAAQIDTARAVLDDCWTKAEAALSQHRWLVGDTFSLADITWVPLHFTLVGANYSFKPYPHVRAWADAVRERASFQQGVLKWCAKF